MKSFKEWRTVEVALNADWEQIKSMKLPANQEIVDYVKPLIGGLQDKLVKNAGLKSYRELTPEMREVFAQAIISATLDMFYGNMSSANRLNAAPPIQKKDLQTPEMILPQDELQTPGASRG